jgi:hypothetical protein
LTDGHQETDPVRKVNKTLVIGLLDWLDWIFSILVPDAVKVKMK